MNRGLFIRTFYEIRVILLIFAVAFGAVEAIISYAIPTLFAQYAEQLVQIEFVQRIISGLIGAELGARIGPASISSFTWVHPIVLAIVWAQAIALCTRVPAGEIDRGTIDVLMALPVSRLRLYVCESAMWAAAGIVLLFAGLIGNRMGGLFVAPEFRASLHHTMLIMTNFFCVYLAVGGMVFLVSAASDRRGAAVGIAIAIVFASFLLSFLAQFWPPAQRLEGLTVLNYYRPLQIVRTGNWPWIDMLVLTVTAAVLWVAGAVIFVRRDIRAA